MHEFGRDRLLRLNSYVAAATATNVWNNTAPTSNVITTSNAINTNGVTYVAYCFAQVAGYSAFGSYTGTGSTDGPFVYTGFRPKVVMIKRTDSTGSWFMVDTSRNTYNLTDLSLYANLSDAEGASTSHCIDILSNTSMLELNFFLVLTNSDVLPISNQFPYSISL